MQNSAQIQSKAVSKMQIINYNIDEPDEPIPPNIQEPNQMLNEM